LLFDICSVTRVLNVRDVVGRNSFLFHTQKNAISILFSASFYCTALYSPRTIQCHLNTNTRLILNIHMLLVSRRELAIHQRTNITFLSYENTVNICIKILAKIYFYLRNIALFSAVATLIIRVGFFMSIEYIFFKYFWQRSIHCILYVCFHHT